MQTSDTAALFTVFRLYPLKAAFRPQSVFLGFICFSEVCGVRTGDQHASSGSRVHLVASSELNSRVFERILIALEFLFNLSCRHIWCYIENV